MNNNILIKIGLSLLLSLGVFTSVHANNVISHEAYASASSSYCMGIGAECYHPARVNDWKLNSAYGGFYSWTADPRQPDEKWVKLHWAKSVTVDKAVVYTTSGYEMRDYKIQYLSGGQWRNIVSTIRNEDQIITHNFPPVTTTQIRLVALKGPLIQPEFGRVNELLVLGAYTSEIGNLRAKCSFRHVSGRTYRFTDESTPSNAITSWRWQFIGATNNPSIDGIGPKTVTFHKDFIPNGRVTIKNSSGKTAAGHCVQK